MKTLVSVVFAGVTALGLTALCAAEGGKAGERWWKDVSFLADDALEGRDTGSPGHKKAAAYVAQEFERAGLRAGGTRGYLQPVPFAVRRIDEEHSSLTLLRGEAAEPLTLGKEATIGIRIQPAPHVEAGIVFLGYGFAVPEKGYDDVSGLDVKGKIVCYISGVPAGIPSELAAHYQSTAERWKRLRAAGAIGTIVIQNPASMDVPWARMSRARLLPAMSLGAGAPDETEGAQIALSWNAQYGDKLMAGTGHTMAELLELATAKKPLPRFALPVRLRAVQTLDKSTVESENVVGVLPGSDRQGELVVLSAHLDHVGKSRALEGDAIHNGAMDNASGIGALLEIARELKEQGFRPRRSIVFVAVTGEEKGLQGSKYYAERPSVAGKMVAELNMDMFLPIHPLKHLRVLGLDESDLGDTLRKIAEGRGVAVQRDPQPERNIFIRSDQYNFVKQGVPAVYPVFGYAPGSAEEKLQKAWLTERYHAVSDDVSQPVDKDAAGQYIGIVAEFTRQVANQEKAPAWKPESFFRRFVK